MLQRVVPRRLALPFASTSQPCASLVSSIMRLSMPGAAQRTPLLRPLATTSPADVPTGSMAAGASSTEHAASPVDVRLVGLVSQWHDEYYGLALPDPIAAGELLLVPGLLWAAAAKDAAFASESPKDYLTRVLERSLDFFDATEDDGLPRVINHAGTLGALRALGRRDGRGQFMLLTGPRSVGKSLMLRKMTAELTLRRQRRVVYVNARQHGTDLVRGIISSLATAPTFLGKMLGYTTGPVVSGVLTILSELPAPGSGAVIAAGKEQLSKSSSNDEEALTTTGAPRLDLLLGAFFDSCKASSEYPIIIIDEANMAFEAASGDEAAAARVRAVLQLFTSVTKELSQASIVLATSEHGLPFRLRALGYSTDHISKTVMAEEVPPALMKDELMRTWGCGEHLATALLSMFGGHVLHASAAVRELATSTNPASMKGITAVGSIASAPARCLSASTLRAAGLPESHWEEMRACVMKALCVLASQGSLPLDSEEDKVAEVISLASAGYVIPLAAAASGVPPEAWRARTASGEAPTHVLVPSSHMMRLLIARKVFPRRD